MGNIFSLPTINPPMNIGFTLMAGKMPWRFGTGIIVYRTAFRPPYSASDYLIKPLSQERLAAVVHRYLPRPEGQPDAAEYLLNPVAAPAQSRHQHLEELRDILNVAYSSSFLH